MATFAQTFVAYGTRFRSVLEAVEPELPVDLLDHPGGLVAHHSRDPDHWHTALKHVAAEGSAKIVRAAVINRWVESIAGGMQVAANV